jgi:hypothetical protein
MEADVDVPRRNILGEHCSPWRAFCNLVETKQKKRVSYYCPVVTPHNCMTVLPLHFRDTHLDLPCTEAKMPTAFETRTIPETSRIRMSLWTLQSAAGRSNPLGSSEPSRRLVSSCRHRNLVQGRPLVLRIGFSVGLVVTQRNIGNNYAEEFQQIRIGYGVVANIADSHSAARGSIPRSRVYFCPLFFLFIYVSLYEGCAMGMDIWRQNISFFFSAIKFKAVEGYRHRAPSMVCE